MVGTSYNLTARSALSQLRNQPYDQKSSVSGPLSISSSERSGGMGMQFFSVRSTMQSEANVFRALSESFGRARGIVAAAQTGTERLAGVLDEVEALIGKVESGSAGSAFEGAMSRLRQQADAAVFGSGYSGTNLLREGETLTVTLGLKAGGGKDFRQLSFEALGLKPTEAARLARTAGGSAGSGGVGNVTQGDVLTARLAELNEQLVGVLAEEQNLGGQVAELDAGRLEISERLGELTTTRDELYTELVDGGARPTDPDKIEDLEDARAYHADAKRYDAQFNFLMASYSRSRARSSADSAGLTISLDRLETLETQLEATNASISGVNAELDDASSQMVMLEEQMMGIGEQKTVLSEEIELITEQLDHLSADQINQNAAAQDESGEPINLEISFDDLLGVVQEKLARGDAAGAQAAVTEVRARIERVQGQLGQIGGALDRRGGFLNEVSDRLDAAVRNGVDEALDDVEAARRASQMISDIARNGRLFGGDGTRAGVLALFAGTGADKAAAFSSSLAMTGAPVAPSAPAEDAPENEYASSF